MKIGLNQLPIWSLDGTICSRNLKSFPTFSIGKKEKKENTFLTNKCYPNSPPDISPSSSIFTKEGVEKPNQLIWQHRGEREREMYIYNRLASNDHSTLFLPTFPLWLASTAGWNWAISNPNWFQTLPPCQAQTQSNTKRPDPSFP